MYKREDTKPVYVSGVKIGGGNVTVQSMCSTKTTDIDKTLAQINSLAAAGCDIVRLAVDSHAAAQAFAEIRKNTDVPLVADIHFDYTLAVKCAQSGADKIRINPGNIGDKENIRQVVSACKERKIPIRIGVNMGSVEKEAERRYGRTPRAMVESAAYHIRLLGEFDFDDIVVSLKASDVVKTVEAYRLFSSLYPYPLHLGITEAGTEYSGIIKSATGIGALLLDGIGDTVRVSLTADPLAEVRAAREILKATGLLKTGIEFISCPTCGRCKIDLINLAKKVEAALCGVDKNIKVAIMGCAVNGPGEARDADIGIAGGSGCAVLFKKGAILRKIKECEIAETLIKEIGDM
jgi:(E)-4-hydroxy-3-methylbut-2-enyl-diphosphate synthase